MSEKWAVFIVVVIIIGAIAYHREKKKSDGFTMLDRIKNLYPKKEK